MRIINSFYLLYACIFSMLESRKRKKCWPTNFVKIRRLWTFLFVVMKLNAFII